MVGHGGKVSFGWSGSGGREAMPEARASRAPRLSPPLSSLGLRAS